MYLMLHSFRFLEVSSGQWGSEHNKNTLLRREGSLFGYTLLSRDLIVKIILVSVC